MTDPDLMPTPIEMEKYVELVKNPVLGSAVLGLPFGLLMYVVAFLGLFPMPGAELSPSQVGGIGWASCALTVYVLISRPY